MKSDRLLPRYNLAADQAFFAELWFNYVHEHSLDSYRVRVLNVANGLRELRKVYWSVGKVEDQKMVRLEVWELLKDDVVLHEPPFSTCCTALLEMMAPSGPLEAAKEEGSAKALMGYFLAELQDLVTKHYVGAVLGLLKGLLVEASFSPLGPTRRIRLIERATAGLLSVLLDNDASIESLFRLYADVLIPRKFKQPYQFARRWGLLEALLSRESQAYRVVIAVENVTTPSDWPATIGHIDFSPRAPISLAPGMPNPNAAALSRYLGTSGKRLFSTQTVTSRDPRAAGVIAVNQLNDVLNLARFEYERSAAAPSDHFACELPGNPAKLRFFPLPMVVPNPASSMDGSGLQAFVRSVDELVAGGRLEQEGRDRVLSAFRLYRTGLDSTTLENKLTNWWTALEYLVRGSEGSGGIGKAVENALPSVLCNAYLAKHLAAIRQALLELRAIVADPLTNAPIALRDLSVVDLFALFKRDDMEAALRDAFLGHPFCERKFVELRERLSTPMKIVEMHADHEKRLRWQLQRLWRARCDIVHSAERTVNAALLCANLEYYLKVVLMALLKALRDVPTLSGPKEFFERQNHLHASVRASLKRGDLSVLLAQLSQ